MRDSYTVTKCRSCGWLKGSPKDHCANPDCANQNKRPALRTHSVICATSPHGFHAPAVTAHYAY